jgi:opacity protein-like surface antigen
VQVTGRLAGAAVNDTRRMDTAVQRYSMSHGLNFILANVVSRRPIPGGRLAVVVRAGLGPTLPHGESVVFGVNRERYEWAGLGLHAAAGLDLHVTGRMSGLVEYKVTYARPTIAIADGTGQMSAATHQVAVGLGVRLGSR